jgi:hypothetical protein
MLALNTHSSQLQNTTLVQENTYLACCDLLQLSPHIEELYFFKIFKRVIIHLYFSMRPFSVACHSLCLLLCL